MRLVKRQQTSNINVGNAIAVCQQEALRAYPLAKPFDARSRLRLEASIDQVDEPVFSIATISVDAAAGQMHGHVRLQMVIIQKVLLDRLRLVSKRNDELIEAVRRIN